MDSTGSPTKDDTKNNFRAVNQLVIDYTNNGERKNRRPDVLLYVNGMPVCIEIHGV